MVVCTHTCTRMHAHACTHIHTYIQGGSNMTGTYAACLHRNQSRSYFNHLVHTYIHTYIHTAIDINNS